ncbi:hypothetical protein [Snodgrassella alvi]|jgi:hypothetical protein|uniref:Uncharacterized protein n=1 Tax=Snodgrassella alvi TaxID=1196083 RepID=A0A855FR97_9NEIS|nr:hypothetical protein [Snodgrassella alvi]PIT44001.1 hypothetical protein BHC51_10220 [Snodgrassella alvi]PIT60339.1 hypothetical protein BHC57_04285 [Snodgrassella alvi]
MIENQTIAQNISDLLLKITRELDESLLQVQEKCSENEFIAYRKVIAQIMSIIYWDALKYIYIKHPSLKPKELD